MPFYLQNPKTCTFPPLRSNSKTPLLRSRPLSGSPFLPMLGSLGAPARWCMLGGAAPAAGERTSTRMHLERPRAGASETRNSGHFVSAPAWLS